MFDNNLNDTAVLFEKMFLKYTIFSNLSAKKDPPSYFKTYNAHLHSATYKLLYVYNVPKQSADRCCHGKFKKLSLKVEIKMVPQRKTNPSWTKFNKVQKHFR